MSEYDVIPFIALMLLLLSLSPFVYMWLSEPLRKHRERKAQRKAWRLEDKRKAKEKEHHERIETLIKLKREMGALNHRREDIEETMRRLPVGTTPQNILQMAVENNRRKHFLWGHYNGGNLGVFVEGLHLRFPEKDCNDTENVRLRSPLMRWVVEWILFRGGECKYGAPPYDTVSGRKIKEVIQSDPRCWTLCSPPSQPSEYTLLYVLDIQAELDDALELQRVEWLALRDEIVAQMREKQAEIDKLSKILGVPARNMMAEFGLTQASVVTSAADPRTRLAKVRVEIEHLREEASSLTQEILEQEQPVGVSSPYRRAADVPTVN